LQYRADIAVEHLKRCKVIGVVREKYRAMRQDQGKVYESLTAGNDTPPTETASENDLVSSSKLPDFVIATE
jgi:hypothetical protein